MEMRSSAGEPKKLGRPRSQNTSQALVGKTPVPNFVLTPQLGPVWLAYLSSWVLSNADPAKVPPPVGLNVAGGSSLPLLFDYRQRAIWRTDKDSRLPVEFLSMDEDGYIKGPLGDQLVRAQRYPPPWDKGFTNIVFRVDLFQDFSGYHLAKKSTLDVFWVWKSNLERIHRFTVEAQQFESAPISPIPQPGTSGVAIVTDGRLSTVSGPIIVSYVSNRFLGTGEIASLPQFKDAVRQSLASRPPRFATPPSGASRLVVLGLMAFVPVGLFLAFRACIKSQRTN